MCCLFIIIVTVNSWITGHHKYNVICRGWCFLQWSLLIRTLINEDTCIIHTLSCGPKWFLENQDIPIIRTLLVIMLEHTGSTVHLTFNKNASDKSVTVCHYLHVLWYNQISRFSLRLQSRFNNLALISSEWMSCIKDPRLIYRTSQNKILRNINNSN